MPRGAHGTARRWLAYAAAASLWTGCQSSAHAPTRARSTAESDVPAPKPPVEPFEPLEAFAGMTVTHSLRTAHPIGAFGAVLRVNNDAAGYGTRGRGAMPEGAVVIESISAKADPEQRPDVHYVMRKRAVGYFAEGGDWEYAVTDAAGLPKAWGRLQLCARCHAEASREFLFEPSRGPAAAGTLGTQNVQGRD